MQEVAPAATGSCFYYMRNITLCPTNNLMQKTSH